MKHEFFKTVPVDNPDGVKVKGRLLSRGNGVVTPCPISAYTSVPSTLKSVRVEGSFPNNYIKYVNTLRCLLCSYLSHGANKIETEGFSEPNLQNMSVNLHYPMVVNPASRLEVKQDLIKTDNLSAGVKRFSLPLHDWMETLDSTMVKIPKIGNIPEKIYSGQLLFTQNGRQQFVDHLHSLMVLQYPGFPKLAVQQYVTSTLYAFSSQNKT